MSNKKNRYDKTGVDDDFDPIIVSRLQVAMASAYALGLASPKDMHDYNISPLLEKASIIRSKIDEWRQYGEIVGIKFFIGDWDRAYNTKYMWMITDQHVVIVSAIKSNIPIGESSDLFKEDWNFGDGVIIPSLENISPDLFIALAPNTLVIDDSIDRISFDGFTPYKSDGQISPAHSHYWYSLRWIKRIILPSKIHFINNSPHFWGVLWGQCDLSRDKYGFWDKYESGDYWDNYRFRWDLRNSVFNEHLTIEFTGGNKSPYFLKNQIVYNASDNTEAYCFDQTINKQRFCMAYDRGVQEQQKRWRERGLCPYCGGTIRNGPFRRCIICGERPNYKPKKTLRNENKY